MRPLRLPPNGTDDQRKVAIAVNQLIERMNLAGVTADRPTSPPTGWQYYDTTIGRPIWWNGSSWLDPRVEQSGLTAARPASPATGQVYFDTTLGKPIWWNGTGWVDATGTAA